MVLSLDSIEPFVTVPQNPPTVLRVPRDVTVQLRAETDRPATFTWIGASAFRRESHGSSARKRFSTPGDYIITVEATFPTGSEPPILRRVFTVSVGTIRARDVRISIADPQAATREIGSTGSIWPCKASITHPQYTHLIQWTAPGGDPSTSIGLTFNPSFRSTGRHSIRVGPDPSQVINLDIYAVTGVTHTSFYGQDIWYGFPILFRAETTPPGYEPYVHWRADTHMDMFTHADPDRGVGPTFTTLFTPATYNKRFWAQVEAEEVPALAQSDPLTPTWPPCETAGVDTAAEYFDFAACFMDFALDSGLAARPLADQTRAAQFRSVYHAAVAHLHTLLINDALPAVSPADRQGFEQSLAASNFMDEYTAYFQIFDPSIPPPSPLTAAEWQQQQDDATKQAVDSVKDPIKNFIGLAGADIKKIGDFVLDIICEIIKILL